MDLNGFFRYLLLGISLSAPIGPVNAAQLNSGIKHGFFPAWFVGIGAMLADAVYMVLIYLGIASFLTTPAVKIALWVFGAVMLVYLGIASLRNLHSSELSVGGFPPSPVKSLSTGFFMALSNPLNIVFWFGIYGAILAESITRSSRIEWLPSLGIFAGIIVWDLMMAITASAFQRFVHPTWLRAISGVAGLLLIGFGLYFGLQAHRAIFN